MSVCAQAHALVKILTKADRRVDRHLLTFVASPPATLVGGLTQGDAVEPGAETCVSVEGADAAEDLDEYFLSDIGGVCGILKAAGDYGVEGLPVLGDEEAERLFGTGLERGDERCVFRPDSDYACEVVSRERPPAFLDAPNLTTSDGEAANAACE